jgi:hypothetical protein
MLNSTIGPIGYLVRLHDVNTLFAKPELLTETLLAQIWASTMFGS